jgi:hypothetical protein
LLDRNNQVFVSGFDYEEDGSFVNTEQYMAPELWGHNTGNRNHEKVVVFSIGVALYYWQTERFPFINASDPFEENPYKVLV